MATGTASPRPVRRDGDRQQRSVPPPADGGRVHDVRVTPTSRRLRLPELAVGVLVTVGFALAAVLWQLSSTERVPALAVAAPVARGETVTAADVRVVYVSAGDDLQRLTDTQSALVVGRVALVDLTPGVLWSPALVSGGVVAADGDGIVGLALEAGQYPAGLIAGDVVNVLAPSSATPEVAAVRGAVVVTVEETHTDGRLLVSLKAPLDNAEQIAVLSASAGGVRVVQVGR